MEYAASPLTYMKHRIDALDKEKLTCTYTMFETDALIMDKIEYITYDVKFEPYGFGGCVCNLTSVYKTKGDVEIREEDIEHGKDRAIGMYEVLEAYLMAHPRAYTWKKPLWLFWELYVFFPNMFSFLFFFFFFSFFFFFFFFRFLSWKMQNTIGMWILLRYGVMLSLGSGFVALQMTNSWQAEKS